MTDTQFLDGFIGELLHINEVADNKLIDLNCCGGTGTYVLAHTCVNVGAYALKTAAERIGKTATTILLNSALAGGEQRVNRHLNTFEWRALSGGTDVKALHAFIAGARRDLIARGNNPLFMSVGALKWRVAVRENGKEVLKDVTSPLIIFPIKLIVSSNAAPVAIEFVDDEIYINPCLIAKLAQIFGQEVADGLPAVGGKDISEPIDLQQLGDGEAYFKAFSDYVKSCNLSDGGDGTLFEFDKDLIAIAQYKHDELCTYYDIRRNKDKIYSHPLVERMFSKSTPAPKNESGICVPDYVLQRDSVQENIITRALGGESLIVKGPPGTGKTATIANMLAALISSNKKVLFASKKISALTEVYAKLPEKLRKFVMLLESETEASAAKLNPEEIKRDFKKLIAESKQYKAPASLEADIRQVSAERAKAMRGLSAYVELTFNDKCIAGDSFYAALDTVCRNDLPVIEFAEESEVKKVTRDDYNLMLSHVGEAQKYYCLLGGDGAHPVYKCPWFGIDLSCDSEKALKACVKIGNLASSVAGSVEDGLKSCGLDINGFTLSQTELVAGGSFDAARIGLLANADVCAHIQETTRRLNDCLALPDGNFVKVETPSGERLETRVIKLGALNADGSLTLEEIRLINSHADIFGFGAESLDALTKIVDEIEKVESEKFKHLSRSHEVFKEGLDDDSLKLILSAGSSLAGYFQNCPQKPKALDFKAKKAYAKLCGFSFLKEPSFKDITGATEQFIAASDCQRVIDDLLSGLYKIFHRQLDGGSVDCVRLVVKKCAGAHKNVCAYVKAVRDNFGFIEKCYAAVEAENKEKITLGGLVEIYNRAYRCGLLGEQLEALNGEVPVVGEVAAGDEVAAARALLGAYGFVGACKAQGVSVENIGKAADFLRGSGRKVCADIRSIAEELENFGNSFFRNYFVINGEDNTFGDLKILSGEADDRDIIAAAANYTALKNSPLNALDLGAFLYWFEKGGRLPAGVTFKDAFEHSFFALAVRAKDGELGIMRNGMGAYAENNLERLKNADERLCALNCDLIESKCLPRIKPDDNDFIFVQDRNPNENLRLMFKRHSRAIKKLKSCLILSPYTASLLFAGGGFDDFDVLIVDEASQLEPALILPVLFRSKQCVIVGDEWQMPPIKHFAALSPVRADEGGEGYASLEPEISALSLALRGGGFAVEELICHYRSKTETLIKFSQEKFYPNMRTFPAPVPAIQPAKGVAGLGIKDVFVDGGVVCAGKNLREAERVVEELNIHFNNYYDQKTHTLAMSVGVVAFGEAQCSAIEAKVRADTALQAKIDDALQHFDDLPEKLIFFKTIETVQGQETEHLILSLTHGRREGGLYMHFGQLNQGKLGRCIFNVAVTRAQCMVTVVHSVRAAEITGENIDYIKEYLQTVERFSQGGGQFVSETTDSGFINEVAAFVRACGFEAERVVTNYGVTEGSVRIPVAVLSKDLKRALLGIWCEKPVGGRYDFIDYNMRYKNTLENCGWRLHSVSVHDWVDNRQNEQEALEKVLLSIKNQEENN